MKKYLFYVVALVIGATMFTSCSKDDDGPVLAETIVFDKGTAELKPGETLQLNVEYTPTDVANKKLQYSTEDSKVATISENGVVTAVGYGKTNVHAMTTDGSLKSTVCEIIVTEDVTVTFEGDEWAKLIDTPQYGGPLIYSEDEYYWEDAKTGLTSGCEKEDWTSYGMGWGWKHGIAISNYVDADASSYDKQLSVPVSNGSKNFAVAWDNDSSLRFANGKSHVIKSIDVINTSYALANITKNNGAGYNFTVTVTALYADGKDNKSLTFDLAKDGNAIDKWTTIDLSSLGEVTLVFFTFDGSDKNDWGLATPKYFALDNVVVKM